MAKGDTLLVGCCEVLGGCGEMGEGARAGGPSDPGLLIGAGAKAGRGPCEVVAFDGAGCPAVVPRCLSIVSHFGAPDSGLGALFRSCRKASGDWNCAVGLGIGRLDDVVPPKFRPRPGLGWPGRIGGIMFNGPLEAEGTLGAHSGVNPPFGL